MRNMLLIVLSVLFFSSTGYSEYLTSEDTFNILRQAPADETFYKGEDPRNTYDPYNDEMHPLPDGRKKYNAAYAWGVTEIGDEIWFGSLNTGWCGWMSTHLRLPLIEAAFNFINTKQICGLMEGRATQLFIYNFKTNSLKAINPDGQIFNGQSMDLQIAPNGENFGDLYNKFKGLNVRAAGNHDGVVFFGALEFDVSGATRLDLVRLIAFDAKKKRFLGSQTFPYDTVRRLNVINHPDGSSALYTYLGPDTSTQQLGKAKSVMLRWVGTKDDPFKGGDDFDGDGKGDGFTIVGEFPVTEGAGGEFVQTKDRVIMSTWAGTQQSIDANTTGQGLTPSAGALFVTSKIPDAGFTKENKAVFTKIFDNDEFEPDPLVAKGYEMGAMSIVGDYLYWGTMHVGTSAGYKYYLKKYPNINECGPESGFHPTFGLPLCKNNQYQDVKFADQVLFNSWRATFLFRTDISTIDDISDSDLPQLGDFPHTEMLYGEDNMTMLDSVPVWDNNSKVHTNVKWKKVDNLKGMKALYGKMGFGNVMNVYTWTMREYNNKIYIGTFDLSGGMGDYLNNEFTEPSEIGNTDNITNYVGIKKAMNWSEDVLMKKLYDWSKGDNATYNAIKDISSAEYTGNFKHGADLFVIEDTSKAGGKIKIVTIDGFNNEGNNGIRNSAIMDGRLIFGTSTYSALDDDGSIAKNGKNGSVSKGGYEYVEVLDGSLPKPVTNSDSGGCSIGNNSDQGLIVLLMSLIIFMGMRLRRRINSGSCGGTR